MTPAEELRAAAARLRQWVKGMSETHPAWEPLADLLDWHADVAGDGAADEALAVACALNGGAS